MSTDIYRRYSIYKITNLINGRIYIGQSIKATGWEGRWKRHLRDSTKQTRKDTVDEAISIYGVENFICEEIDFIENVKHTDDRYAQDRTQINLMERYYIWRLDSMNPDVGYNKRQGGTGGFVNTPEHQAKALAKSIAKGIPKAVRSAARKKAWDNATDEERAIHSAAVSKAKRGKPNPKVSIALKERLKDKTKHSMWGRKHSEESKRLMSEAKKRNKLSDQPITNPSGS